MANSPSTPGPSGWSVTSQIEATRPDANGRFVPGMVVSFVTGHGVNASVFVPDSLYNESTVTAMIAQKVAALDAISGLSG